MAMSRPNTLVIRRFVDSEVLRCDVLPLNCTGVRRLEGRWQDRLGGGGSLHGAVREVGSAERPDKRPHLVARSDGCFYEAF